MINELYDLTDWTSNNGVTENNDIYKYNQPSLLFASGLPSYVMKDLGRQHNDTYITWIRCDTVADIDFKFIFGSNELGDGFAFNLTQYNARLINISTFNESAEIVNEYVPFMWLADSTWHEIKVIIINDKIQFYVNNQLLIEYLDFSKVGDYIGFHNNSSLTDTYIGDTIWYDDQILWGNINVNGVNDEDGWIVLYKQTGIEYIENTFADERGNWAIFVKEDPRQQFKHILVGGITSRENLQPKGISSITL